MGDADEIMVYSDYVCPFCYLGRRSFESFRSAHDRPLEIDWHPFDLRRHKRRADGSIDPTVDDGKDDAYFEQVQRNVDRLREAYGVEGMLDRDAIPDGVDSRNAQLASLVVKTEHPDRWEAFDVAVFDALWVEGRDIGAVEVLVELADGVGLDGDALRTAVADEPLHEELERAFAAAERDGITGVPTFVYDGHAARGAVPPDQLRRLVGGH